MSFSLFVFGPWNPVNNLMASLFADKETVTLGNLLKDTQLESGTINGHKEPVNALIGV